MLASFVDSAFLVELESGDALNKLNNLTHLTPWNHRSVSTSPYDVMF